MVFKAAARHNAGSSLEGPALLFMGISLVLQYHQRHFYFALKLLLAAGTVADVLDLEVEDNSDGAFGLNDLDGAGLYFQET